MMPSTNMHPEMDYNIKPLNDHSLNENTSGIKPYCQNVRTGYGPDCDIYVDPYKETRNNSSSLSNQAPTFAADAFRGTKQCGNYSKFLK